MFISTLEEAKKMQKRFLKRAALAITVFGISGSVFALPTTTVDGGAATAQVQRAKRAQEALAQAEALSPGESVVAAPEPAKKPGILTFTITPQSGNLRSALEGFLTAQGYQLAWKVDDDLPAGFDATFRGSLDMILAQVMAATNHMSTPSRVCEHINKVIRVIPRAANCKD
jgi:hypothetical protein